ncbi:coiled-coil domain-containing protein 50-like [Conger conger]|uniref:coiled-coil domain-containing protein 50-like n=1 Tax=Conger conger TaxID=82655 RepID=UPI002A5A4DC4|nr:coiled-coil domain-containing protein 50-like [Conger conger]
MIQEEIQRRAAEARKRERDDEEVAKRIQEEEVRGTAELESGCHGKFTRFPLSEGAVLELGSLQQVLLDHELAWRLQEAERDRNLHRVSHSPPLPPSSAPEGDSRVAQVAQDEEIARFMQRQEMKTKRRSCDMEGQGSQQERWEAGERRASQELKVQVLREEPPSPSQERTQPSNHRRQPIRNIAEELDPTFKARRKDIGQSGLSCSDLCQAPSTPGRGFHDYTEEPLFIPPTKRQSGQSGHGKAKEKKESCKQQ